MLNEQLADTLAGLAKNKTISDDDVRHLARDIVPDGIATREEADMLLALDRVVTQAGPLWEDFLVATLVDFVVWDSRPTGRVDRDTARWLIDSLSAGTGASTRAHRAAFEIVREADSVCDALSAFVMAGSRRKGAAPGRPVHAGTL